MPSRLAIWVDALSLILWFDDTPDELQRAKAALLDEWNSVRVLGHISVDAIAWLRERFYIRRIQDGKPDECVCTLDEAVTDSAA